MSKKSNVFILIIVFLLLLLPITFIIYRNDYVLNLIAAVVSTAGLTLLLVSVFNGLKSINIALAKVFIIIGVLTFFIIRLTLSFVYDFSGRGFSSEFFAHISWTSLVVGLEEYGYLLFIIVLLLIYIFAKFNQILNKHKIYTMRTNLVIFACATGLIGFNLNSVPEWKFIVAYKHYHAPLIIPTDKYQSRVQTKSLLRSLRGNRALPVEKSEIIAKTSIQPKNLIIIYLESFSEILTENKRYPGLTPNIDQLKSDHLSFSTNLSSAYVTIEGLANSQCGTLMNMENGENSLTNQFGRLPNLPCLGDVLHEAGYKQIFYGGAKVDFAGKGAFLAEHGYDEVWGLSDWKKKGFDSENTWGLTDSNLFKQAMQRLVELRKAKQPFNLTLLTLGTHLPGFVYQGCNKYQGTKPSHQFLDAIHCTDQLLGDFIQKLKNQGFLEDTVVLIQGDHPVFPTHEMKQLFLEQTTDNRILTIYIVPEKHPATIKNQTSSSLNMAANLLDLLQIQHNVEFILGFSDFSKSVQRPYLITRYEDYFDTEKIANLTAHTQCTEKNHLTPPLDYCEKKLAIKSLYELGASYSHQNLFQEVCQLGAHVSVDPNDQAINLRWGNQNLSHQFSYQGRVLDKPKQGLYLLLLDQNDQVLSPLFYPFEDASEVQSLSKQLIKSDSRYLLFSNLSTEQINRLNLSNVPASFATNKIIYSQNIDEKISPLLDSLNLNKQVNFIPRSCLEKSNKADIENSFCGIEDWGPKMVILGQKFLQQKSGESAFWLKTNCMPEQAVFRIDGQALKTFNKRPIITAHTMAHEQITEARAYVLDLYDPNTSQSKLIGELTVIENNNSPIQEPESALSLKPPRLIAHAGGGYKQQTYLNTIEALDYNYALGHRYFELDLNWTSDQQLVAIHDWEKAYQDLFEKATEETPSLSEFLELNMKNKQTQMDLNRLAAWLSQHPDAYIITDVKGQNMKALKQIVGKIKNANQQIIPQMYQAQNYQAIHSLGYEKIIFTLYSTPLKTKELIEFIQSHALFAVTVHPDKKDFNDIIKVLANSSVFIYVHTYNTIAEMHYFLSLGVDGLYTDFLYLNQHNTVTKQE